tara:strand:- start:67 stop:633 length:567 start_codon:yes stop_codon:yes gene_type:complete
MAQKRYYKTATGKNIDLETMMLKNEDTIAVGNKFVNARGDELGTGGEVIRSREEVIQDYYRIHNGTIPQDRPIPEADEVVNTPEQVKDNKPTDLNKDPILAEIEANEPDEDMVDATTLANTLASTAETVANKPANAVVEDEVIEETTTEEQPRGGLASAVAKAKTVRSVTPKKTEQQQVKETGGVKRF